MTFHLLCPLRGISFTTVFQEDNVLHGHSCPLSGDAAHHTEYYIEPFVNRVQHFLLSASIVGNSP